MSAPPSSGNAAALVPRNPECDPSPGEGWVLRCPTCGETGLTDPGGRCPLCQAATSLPVLLRPLDRLPASLRTALRILSPAPAAFRRWLRRSPFSFMFFWLAFFTGFHPLSSGFVGLFLWGWLLDTVFPPPPSRDDQPLRIDREPMAATRELPTGASPRPSITRIHDPRLALSRSWWTIQRIRSRRGVAVHAGLRLRGLQGEFLTLELRVLGPDGRYLRSALSVYRGPSGEALASHRTRRLRHDDSRFPDLWLFLPMRALGLPRCLARAELIAELRLTAGRRHLATHLLPMDFLPVPEDLWDLPTGEIPRIEGLKLVGEVTESRAAPCGVCGDTDDEVTTSCPVCGAKHHPECWAYLDGCSRFGCSEAPRTHPNAS